MNPQELQLIAAYLDGTLAEADLPKLESLLRNSREARAKLRLMATIDEGLSEFGPAVSLEHQNPQTDDAPGSGSPRRRLWPIALAAAACVGLILTIGVFTGNKPSPESLVATLIEFHGDVEIELAGLRRPAVKGAALQSNEILVVESNDKGPTGQRLGLAVVGYPDGTRVVLMENASVTFAGKTQKQVILHSGQISASVKPQDKFLLIQSANAEVRVLGTQLSVRADTDRTEVDVIKGLVEVKELAGDQSVQVPAGKRTVVGSGLKLVVQDIVLPSERWEENFEKGIPKTWHALLVSNGLPPGSNGAAKADISGAKETMRYGISCRAPNMYGLFSIGNTSHLNITFKVADHRGLDLYLETRRLDPSTSGQYSYYKSSALSGAATVAGRWQTISIPLSHFVRTGQVFKDWRASPAAPHAAAPRVSIEPSINLLSRIDLKKDAISGNWRLDEGKLIGDDTKFSVLALPVTVPAEYDLEIQGQWLDGSGELLLLLRKDGHGVRFKLNAFHDQGTVQGLTIVDGKHLKHKDNPTRVVGKLINKNTPYTLKCSVRQESIQISLDGKTIVNYTGKADQLKLCSDDGPTPKDRVLAISVLSSKIAFSKILFRPITSGPRPGEAPIRFGISSNAPDPLLVVDRIWVTPDGPEKIEVKDHEK